MRRPDYYGSCSGLVRIEKYAFSSGARTVWTGPGFRAISQGKEFAMERFTHDLVQRDVHGQGSGRGAVT